MPADDRVPLRVVTFLADDIKPLTGENRVDVTFKLSRPPTTFEADYCNSQTVGNMDRLHLTAGIGRVELEAVDIAKLQDWMNVLNELLAIVDQEAYREERAWHRLKMDAVKKLATIDFSA